MVYPQPEPEPYSHRLHSRREISQNSNKQRPDKQRCRIPCIYRVPPVINNLNLENYQPRVVSFGPYHHVKDHLRPMEEHKYRAHDQFFKRFGKSPTTFLDFLRKVEDELKDSYDVLDLKWKEGTGDQFLKMMIRDGCFMLEIMTAAMTKEEENDYALGDLIFGTHRYITPYIRWDMLKLENQLPMLVLYELIAFANDGKEVLLPQRGHQGDGQMPHVLDVFRKGLLMESGKDQHGRENVGPEAGEGDNSSLKTCIPGMGHVVEVFGKCLPKETENVQHERIFRSATELDEARIQFKKSQTSSLKDISFDGGVLKLPRIIVDDTVKSVFLNVMTFERLRIGTGSEVTSYVVFMDHIITDEGDVALLHARGIIRNAIGSNEAVAELFNSLGEEVTLAPNSSLETVQNKISKHCEQPWNKWRANLNRNYYFKNPWTLLSLTATILLFVFTIIQTVYAVLDHY